MILRLVRVLKAAKQTTCVFVFGRERNRTPRKDRSMKCCKLSQRAERYPEPC